MTRRHVSTIHSLAACLSRVADAEWLRSCEGVRRFAPIIGQLGEWRVYCEGGWSAPLPPDLPDRDVPNRSDRSATPVPQGRTATLNTEQPTQAPGTPMLEKPAPEYSSRHPSEQEGGASSQPVTPNRNPSPLHPRYHAPARDEPVDKVSSLPPPKIVADASVRSIASLSSFPAPPTHFPMPPMAKTEINSPIKESRPASPRGPRTPSEILFQRQTDSPAPLTPSDTPRSLPSSPAAQHTEPSVIVANARTADDRSTEGTSRSQHSIGPDERDTHDGRETRTPSPALTRATSKKIKFEGAESSLNLVSVGGSSHSNPVGDGEFGVLRPRDEKQPRQGSSSEGPTSQPIERSDTGVSSGSVVAALRDRYSRMVSRS